jgi:flagellar protein FliS
MNPYLKQYQQNSVTTASPEKILIMLYDGAIQFLNKAKIAMQNKNIEDTHNNIIGAERIIAEFMNTLDMELGGEVAKNLYKLYEYLNYRLVQANIKKDVIIIDEVLTHLKDLKQTWEQAIRIAARENALSNQEELGQTVKMA